MGVGGGSEQSKRDPKDNAIRKRWRVDSRQYRGQQGAAFRSICTLWPLIEHPVLISIIVSHCQKLSLVPTD